MSLSPLSANVFLAPPLLAVPPIPLPNNTAPVWSPTTSTLIHSAHEAVLVDPLLTAAQATALADWISDLIPTKRLTTIYITHGHGDHFFGLSTLLQRFPNANAVATAGTLAHMESQLSPASRTVWTTWFPIENITFPASPPARALDPANLTIDLEGHTLHAIPTGHADTDDSSFLWVPELKLAAVGDIALSGTYPYLAESLTPELRAQWIASIKKVQSFGPEIVVAGHKALGAVDAKWALERTKAYLELWDKEAEVATGAEDMFWRMRTQEPDRTGAFLLWVSSLAQFPAPNATARA